MLLDLGFEPWTLCMLGRYESNVGIIHKRDEWGMQNELYDNFENGC